MSKRANEAAAQTDGADDAFAYRRIDALAEVRSGQISRDTLYRLRREGVLPIIQTGRSFLVRTDWAEYARRTQAELKTKEGDEK